MAAPETSDRSGIIYKYTDEKGAEKILSNRTLRFARPSEMNDPFDVNINDIFGMDFEEFFKKSRTVFVDLLLEDPKRYAEICEIDVETAESKAAYLRALPEDKRAALREHLAQLDLAGRDPTFDALMETLLVQRDDFQERFSNYGIFCATGTCHNLLMWAHYANQHRGAVLGFLPDLKKDSFLRLMTAVTYSKDRPFLFDETQRILLDTLSMTPEKAKERTDRLLHSKSAEWSYEEEWRLCIPEETKNKAASFLPFYPNELVEVYLGYRMSGDNRAQVARLAKNLNPDVQIYSAGLAKREYALEFTRLA